MFFSAYQIQREITLIDELNKKLLDASIHTGMSEADRHQHVRFIEMGLEKIKALHAVTGEKTAHKTLMRECQKIRFSTHLRYADILMRTHSKKVLEKKYHWLSPLRQKLILTTKQSLRDHELNAMVQLANMISFSLSEDVLAYGGLVAAHAIRVLKKIARESQGNTLTLSEKGYQEINAFSLPIRFILQDIESCPLSKSPTEEQKEIIRSLFVATLEASPCLTPFFGRKAKNATLRTVLDKVDLCETFEHLKDCFDEFVFESCKHRLPVKNTYKSDTLSAKVLIHGLMDLHDRGLKTILLGREANTKEAIEQHFLYIIRQQKRSYFNHLVSTSAM